MNSYDLAILSIKIESIFIKIKLRILDKCKFSFEQ